MHLSWNSSSTMLWLAPSALAEGVPGSEAAAAPGDVEAHSTEPRAGVIDVGRRGRLVGLEVRLPRESMRRWAADLPAHFFDIPVDGHIYVALDGDGGGVDEVRSAPLTTTIEFDADGMVLRIGVPRRGPGWELSWPSGNE